MLLRSGQLFAALLLVAGAALLPASASGQVSGHRLAGPSANGVSARDYWTPARMRQAKPLRSVLPGGGMPFPSDVDPAPQVPGHVDLANVRPARAPGEIHPGDRPPFKSGQVPLALQTTFPYSANGRLFGKFPHGVGYSCSATVVTSSTQSTILTAGHCVHDMELGYAKWVLFAPAFHARSRPFGVWSASFEVASDAWLRGNYNYDYAALRLRPNDRGTVGSVVGEEGIAVNQPREQTFQAIGYPYNVGKTKQMRNCLGAFAGIDPRDRQAGQSDNGIGCNMRSGASGGAWTIRDANGVPYVNSVTSFTYDGIKDVLFGPYLTQRVFDVVNKANRPGG